jgi:hypothetical protein
MRLLLIVFVVIAVLWPVYWLLTRRRLPVRRRWGWRRAYWRTLDKLLTDPTNQGIFAIVLWSPLVLYFATSDLVGFRRTTLGWAVAGSGSFIIGFLAVRRAAKWMKRSWRPTRDWLRERRAKRVRR